MAVISTANAIPHQPQKRTTHFEKCNFIDPLPTLLNVKLNPDPVVSGKNDTFNVSGTLDTDITEITGLLIQYVDPETKKTVGDQYVGSICTGTDCPIKAKTPFNKLATFLAPPTLPNPYQILVAVIESDGKILENEPEPLLGCAMATVA
ncbi:16694_t:CDS:1 [Funneliformis mosseae]|uniref:Phosphatidylglycerol/phosphatidylinositol transfer protein n=1 Tax=Funneliformis mosseae TaxID=27381 RepID=A0A9N9C9E1_FUNMO|nr:16694_t:CDS:1 [Funneliformis mosseae]